MRRSSTSGPLERAQALPRRVGQQRAADQPQRHAGLGLRLGGGAQQRLADEPPARRHHHVLAARRRARVALADDEAGVVDGHAQRLPRRERLLEPGEPRVAVDEHGVEVGVGERGGAVVVRLLVGARADEDVAQAAGGERAVGARGLEQRHELAGELRAPEREQLDDHGGRPDRAVGGEDPLARAPPTPARASSAGRG